MGAIWFILGLILGTMMGGFVALFYAGSQVNKVKVVSENKEEK